MEQINCTESELTIKDNQIFLKNYRVVGDYVGDYKILNNTLTIYPSAFLDWLRSGYTKHYRENNRLALDFNIGDQNEQTSKR